MPLLLKALTTAGRPGSISVRSVQVAGYTTRAGTVVAPYRATRRAAAGDGLRRAGRMTDQQRVELEDYKAGGYRDLNRHLRAPEGTRPSLAPYLDRMARAIDRSIAKSEVERPLTVFRGMQHRGLAVQAERLLGQTFPLSSFWSTSRNEGEARRYAGFGPDGVLFRIKVPKGAHALDMEEYASGASVGEAELLLSRHARVRVVGVERQGSTAVVTAEYLPG